MTIEALPLHSSARPFKDADEEKVPELSEKLSLPDGYNSDSEIRDFSRPSLQRSGLDESSPPAHRQIQIRDGFSPPILPLPATPRKAQEEKKEDLEPS